LVSLNYSEGVSGRGESQLPKENDPRPQEHCRERRRNPECFEQINFLRDRASGSVIAPKETHQLQEKLSREARRQPRMNPMAKDRTIWLGRLRRRPEADGTSRDTTKATKTQIGKPRGIMKYRKASKKKRLR